MFYRFFSPHPPPAAEMTQESSSNRASEILEVHHLGNGLVSVVHLMTINTESPNLAGSGLNSPAPL